MRTEARFPAVAPGDGHYESFYMKAAEPRGGRAIWIRHTIHKRPDQDPTGAVWLTMFDDSRGAPRATKRQFGMDALSTPAGAYVRVGESEIGPGRVNGKVSGDGLEASWGLRFSDRHASLRHLPAEWMYRGALPRTKVLSPHPGALFDGTFEIGGERIEISAWPGMVGHNWGAEHARRWVWIHGTGLDGGEETDFLDIAAGQVKLGGLTTPWIANGALTLGGKRYRLGGLGRIRKTEMEAEFTGCSFTVPGPGVKVRGRVGASPEQFVAWLYSDPAGGSHHSLNCSVSDMELTVERRGQEDATLRVERGATYELGTLDTDHGIPLQPYEDG